MKELFKNREIMKQITILLIALFTMTTTSAITACSPDNEPEKVQPPAPKPEPEPNPGPEPEPAPEPSTGNRVRITIGSARFTATLQDNAATTAFKAMLPMTVTMSELNNNEKYASLPTSVPTSVTSPGTIQTGDLMVWGSNTLVLFYKTFSSSYSYTRLGSIDDPSGLQSAVGAGSVTVTFEAL